MGPQDNYHLLFIPRGASQGSAWQIPKVWKQISLKITGCSHHQPVTTNQSGIFAFTMLLCHHQNFGGQPQPEWPPLFASTYQRKTMRNVPLVTQFIIVAVKIHLFQSAVVTGWWFFATHLKNMLVESGNHFPPKKKKKNTFVSKHHPSNLPPKANMFCT